LIGCVTSSSGLPVYQRGQLRWRRRRADGAGSTIPWISVTARIGIMAQKWPLPALRQKILHGGHAGIGENLPFTLKDGDLL